MTATPGTLLMKWQLLQAVLCDPTLSPAAKVVAARLLHHHNTLTGQCSPSYETLSQAVGAARSTVIKTVAELRAAGWLTVERVKVPGRTGAQSHVSNRYAFAFNRVAEDQGGSPKSAPPPSPDFRPPPSPKSGPPPSPKSAPPPSEIRTRGSPKSGPEHGKLEQGKRKKTLSVIEPTAFDRWWSLYPRKVGKDAARPVFDRVLKAGKASLDELLAGAARYAAERTDEDDTYTQHPKTWLNGGHWADEPMAPSRARPRPRAEKSGVTDLLRDIEDRIRERDNPQDARQRRAGSGTWPADRSLDGRDGMGGAGPVLDIEPIRPKRE